MPYRLFHGLLRQARKLFPRGRDGGYALPPRRLNRLNQAPARFAFSPRRVPQLQQALPRRCTERARRDQRPCLQRGV